MKCPCINQLDIGIMLIHVHPGSGKFHPALSKGVITVQKLMLSSNTKAVHVKITTHVDL